MLSDKQKELVYDLFKKHSCKYHFEEDPPQSLLDCDDFFDALSALLTTLILSELTPCAIKALRTVAARAVDSLSLCLSVPMVSVLEVTWSTIECSVPAAVAAATTTFRPAASNFETSLAKKIL